jgi:predicted  nucleic acid-binding Zn-ribbon protein
MESTNKIKQEQLETIRTQQKELNTLLNNIGVLESQKHSLLHKLADINKAIDEFKTELFNEYGNVNINIEDGSYTEMEVKAEPETVGE